MICYSNLKVEIVSFQIVIILQKLPNLKGFYIKKLITFVHEYPVYVIYNSANTCFEQKI